MQVCPLVAGQQQDTHAGCQKPLHVFCCNSAGSLCLSTVPPHKLGDHQPKVFITVLSKCSLEIKRSCERELEKLHESVDRFISRDTAGSGYRFGMDSFLLRDIIHATTSMINTDYEYNQVSQ